MADFGIVAEKLMSFESADDLADYLRDYGIKAEPQNARACAISVFVEQETGLTGKIITTTQTLTHDELNDLGYYDTYEQFNHTDAMREFVKAFDKGMYPSLIIDGYEFDVAEYSCSCSLCQG